MYKIQVFFNNTKSLVTLESDPLTKEDADKWVKIIEKLTGEDAFVIPVEWL